MSSYGDLLEVEVLVVEIPSPEVLIGGYPSPFRSRPNPRPAHSQLLSVRAPTTGHFCGTGRPGNPCKGHESIWSDEGSERRRAGLVSVGGDRRSHDRLDKTIADFSSKMRDQIDLDSLTTELAGVVRETVQPTHVSLWLRS
jgi:hypothetical protein